jgi:hypothetical protein
MPPCRPTAPNRARTSWSSHHSRYSSPNSLPWSLTVYLGTRPAHLAAPSSTMQISPAEGRLLKEARPRERRDWWSMTTAGHQQKGQGWLDEGEGEPTRPEARAGRDSCGVNSPDVIWVVGYHRTRLGRCQRLVGILGRCHWRRRCGCAVQYAFDGRRRDVKARAGKEVGDEPPAHHGKEPLALGDHRGDEVGELVDRDLGLHGCTGPLLLAAAVPTRDRLETWRNSVDRYRTSQRPLT